MIPCRNVNATLLHSACATFHLSVVIVELQVILGEGSLRSVVISSERPISGSLGGWDIVRPYTDRMGFSCPVTIFWK